MLLQFKGTASQNSAPRHTRRVECGRPFLSGQNRATNQRSGMILDVQNRRFSEHARSAHRRMRTKVFIFKKFLGAKKLIFFCGNGQKASFYLREDSPTRKFSIH